MPPRVRQVVSHESIFNCGYLNPFTHPLARQDESIPERFFGLVRPDGTLKPHADVIRPFAATRPIVASSSKRVALDISPAAFCADPLAHSRRLYQSFNPP